MRKAILMLLLADVSSNAMAEWVRVGGEGIMRFGNEDIT